MPPMGISRPARCPRAAPLCPGGAEQEGRRQEQARRPWLSTAPLPHQPQSNPASSETPSCTYRNRTAKVSLLQTINSLFIVSIWREAATLISGLLHKAYSRLLSGLRDKCKCQGPCCPQSLTCPVRRTSPGSNPRCFQVVQAQLQRTSSLSTQTTIREASRSPCTHAWGRSSDTKDASHAHAM